MTKIGLFLNPSWSQVSAMENWLLKLPMKPNLNLIGHNQSMHKSISLKSIHIIYRSPKIGISKIQPPLCAPVELSYLTRSHKGILNIRNIYTKYKTTVL